MSIYNYAGMPIEVGNAADVTSYGAKGDGVTDDAGSIQAALDDMIDGGIILFPPGTYLITKSVLFYSNQLLFFSPGAAIKQGASIDNLMMSYCPAGTTVYNGVHDTVICGAIFDGGTYTTNNTLVGLVHTQNVIIERCTFINAYGTWHDLEINSSKNAKVIDCVFEGHRKTGQNACLIQIDAINNSSTWPWPDNIGSIDGTVSKFIEISGTLFTNCTISPAIGNHSAAVDDCINIHDCIFDGLTSARGAINFQSASNVDISNNLFNGCTTGVGSSAATYYIRNNRFIGATTAAAGEVSVIHGNMVNGEYIA